jgi:hypothetical protein
VRDGETSLHAGGAVRLAGLEAGEHSLLVIGDAQLSGLCGDKGERCVDIGYGNVEKNLGRSDELCHIVPPFAKKARHTQCRAPLV